MDASLPQSARPSSLDAPRRGPLSATAPNAGGIPSQAPRPQDANLGPSDSAAPLAGLGPCNWPELESDTHAASAPDFEPCDQELDVRIVLGRVSGGTQAAAQLAAGRVVALDTDAHAPVEIWSAKQLIARGQLQTLDGHYCVQVTELLDRPSRKSHP